MKRETKLSEVKRHWIPGRTSYKSLAIHIDELPVKVNDRNLYYADAWIPTDGIRDVILIDGKKAEATFTDEKGWDSPVARFFASDGETVKHADIEEYNYVPDADDDLKHEAFEKLSPRIKQVLERIRLITRAGKFTFEEFAAEVIDPQTGKVYPKYQTNTGENQLRDIENENLIRLACSRKWKDYYIKVTPRFGVNVLFPKFFI